MLKHLKKIIFISILSFSTAHAAFEIIPKDNGSGILPNGHDEIIFKLSNGHWTKNVSFPTRPLNNDLVTIKSSADYNTYIDGNKTNLPFKTLLLKDGQYYKFRYNATKNEWISQVSGQYPVNDSPQTTVKISDNNVVKFSVEDGRWTQNIILPNNILSTKFAFISSEASTPAKIHASGKTYSLIKDQFYIFVFDKNNKWRVAKEF